MSSLRDEKFKMTKTRLKQRIGNSRKIQTSSRPDHWYRVIRAILSRNSSRPSTPIGTAEKWRRYSSARNELHPHGQQMESRLERPIGRTGAVSQTDRRKFSANEALRSLRSPLTTPLPALRLFLFTLAISFHHNARRKCLEERTEQIYTR